MLMESIDTRTLILDLARYERKYAMTSLACSKLYVKGNVRNLRKTVPEAHEWMALWSQYLTVIATFVDTEMRSLDGPVDDTP